MLACRIANHLCSHTADVNFVPNYEAEIKINQFLLQIKFLAWNLKVKFVIYWILHLLTWWEYKFGFCSGKVRHSLILLSSHSLYICWLYFEKWVLGARRYWFSVFWTKNWKKFEFCHFRAHIMQHEKSQPDIPWGQRGKRFWLMSNIKAWNGNISSPQNLPELTCFFGRF